VGPAYRGKGRGRCVVTSALGQRALAFRAGQGGWYSVRHTSASVGGRMGVGSRAQAGAVIGRIPLIDLAQGRHRNRAHTAYRFGGRASP
jgi:hypothetical protein